jgi:hypothetical protein
MVALAQQAAELQPLDLPCSFTHTTPRAIFVFLVGDFLFVSYTRLPEFYEKKRSNCDVGEFSFISSRNNILFAMLENTIPKVGI